MSRHGIQRVIIYYVKILVHEIAVKRRLYCVNLSVEIHFYC